MKKLTKVSYFIILFSFFTSLNLYFSKLITYKLSQGWQYSNSVFKLIYAENTGAAFSIMQNSTHFLIILSIIALLIIGYFAIKNLENLHLKWILFLSVLTSGIFVNLLQRIFYGHVKDYFELNFIDFPIFNISDIFINIGVFGIIILILLAKKPIRLL